MRSVAGSVGADVAGAQIAFWGLVLAIPYVGANGYYTAKAYLGPEKMNSRSGRNAIAWTSWQAAILDGVAVGVQDAESSPILIGLGTWPLSVTARGVWALRSSTDVTRGVAFGVVAASDAILLSYDVERLVAGDRVVATYALVETGLGALQAGFGIITALRAEGTDATAAWATTAPPFTLMPHGLLSLTLPERHEVID